MFNIAIFASGTGTNAEKIIDHFKDETEITVSLLISDRKKAGALTVADKNGINSKHFSRKELSEQGGKILRYLDEEKIDFIVLAGFLFLVPPEIVKAYKGKIVNIHPALLPDFGGKGMYGDRVHKAVIENKRKISGITIHHVDEEYDQGRVILQEEIQVDEGETPESLRRKIQQLEHFHYPRAIEKLIKTKLL